MLPRDSEHVFGVDYARQWHLTTATIRNWRRRGKAAPVDQFPGKGALYRRAELDAARTTRRHQGPRPTNRERPRDPAGRYLSPATHAE